MPMHIVDFVQQVDTTRYFSILAIVLLINVLFFRKLAFNRYDPLWIVVLSLSFQLTTPIYLWLVDQDIELKYLVYIICAVLLFWVGAFIAQQFLRMPRSSLTDGAHSSQRYPLTAQKGKERFIYIFLTWSTLMLMLALLVRAFTSGLPIFANNPELEKLLVNRGGLGVLERIIEPSVNCSLIFIYYLARMKGRFTLKLLIYMVIPLLALLVSGSKSALLTVYYTFYFANTYAALRERQRFAFVSMKVVISGAVAVLAYATFVLIARANGSGIVDVNKFVAQTLLTRFIGFSDGIYYFFEGTTLYSRLHYGIGDYFYLYWIVPLLAPLRLVPYPAQALGNEIIATKLGGIWLGGPNPTMSVEGFIFFGFGGLLYCFFLGVLFSFCRRIMLKIKMRGNLQALLLFSIGNLLSLKIASDMILFTASLFDYFFIAISTFILGCLVYSVQKYLPHTFVDTTLEAYTKPTNPAHQS